MDISSVLFVTTLVVLIRESAPQFRQSDEFTTSTLPEIQPIVDVLERLDHKGIPCNQCPVVYFPVCTSKLKTFRNHCLFLCQNNDPNEQVSYRGLCMHWLWQLGK